MARYLNESDVYNLLGECGMATVHCSQIDVLPRADVAPRAEVAREIFEELDKKIFNHIPDLHTFEIYTELKKKYTEPEPPDMKEGKE